MMREFVHTRLDAMRHRPSMWAGTKEAFGLQLVLLAEVFRLGAMTRSHELMLLIFGPGNTVPRDDIDETWARDRVDIVRRYITEKLDLQ
jgi:hypothetical protein